MSLSREYEKLSQQLDVLKEEKKGTKRDSPRWLHLLQEIDDLETQLELWHDDDGLPNYEMD